jgi:DNA gyrase/topoisomerase IV subunit A
MIERGGVMARKTELTQELVNETAEELHGKGVKPSPNNVREVLGTGSYSTIKKMLDVWNEKQEADENVFIPDTPDFAYRIVDKLHKELYLQNRKLLDSERQQLELSRQEMEVEKSEMLLEINSLEESSKSLKGELTNKIDELTRLKTDLDISQVKLDKLSNDFNEQKIEIATLTERDKQQALQLKEKEASLKQAEEQEKSLVKKMEADKT